MNTLEESYGLFRKFIESNFYIDSDGNFQYIWREDVTPKHGKEVKQLAIKEKWNFDL